MKIGVTIGSAALAFALGSTAANAAVIFATGQLRSDGHAHASGNYVFRIDADTGKATPVTGVINRPVPAALAGTTSERLIGFTGGRLVQIDTYADTWTPFAPASGISAFGLEIVGGSAYTLPFDAAFETQQLHRIDLVSGVATASGAASAAGDAIDLALGRALGTAEPFIIGLGAVGNTLYGVDLDTYSLIAFDPASGTAALVGAPGAVTAGDRSIYAGFSALTGFDRDDDGVFDELLTTVNFTVEGNVSTRLGGIGRFNLGDGSFDLIGTNPGVIFFGLGSVAVPEPGWLIVPALAALVAIRRGRA